MIRARRGSVRSAATRSTAPIDSPGSCSGTRARPRDATQDALARAWRQRSSLRSLDAAQAWFDRILVNVCRDRLRRRRPRVRWADVDEGLTSPAADPFAALLARDAVLRAMTGLPIDQRVVLVLRYWADLPVDAIADRLGIPTGTVTSRLHYALRGLRAALTDPT